MEEKYHYVEIRGKYTNIVFKRIAVSGGERNMERVESGVNINLDHELYCTESVTSEVELKEI